MSKISEVLKAIDEKLNEVQPATMDQLIDIVHRVEGAGNYGTYFTIVKYKGYTQGVRVYVTGSKISHQLPGKGKVYSVFQGLEEFEKAGYQIETQ